MSTPVQDRTAGNAKTPGFTAALFGFLSTKKKPRISGDAGTSPTTSTARAPRHHHAPVDVSMSTDAAEPTRVEATSAVDLLDTGVTSSSFSPPAAGGPSLTASLPSKSPWKSPSGGSSIIQFSHGILKPAPVNGISNRPTRTTGLQRRRRYKPSRLMASGKKRTTGPINIANAVNALQQSQNLFQPSQSQLEAQSNYVGFKARKGKRLLGTAQQGGSRLPPPVPAAEVSSPRIEPATKRRRQVMFGEAVDSTPIESEMMTPVKPSAPFAGGKRKATPYKTVSEESEDEETPAPMKPVVSATSFPPPGPANEQLSVPKLVIEVDKNVLEDPHEAKPLGTPVSARSSRLLSNQALHLQGLKNIDFTAAKMSYFDENDKSYKVKHSKDSKSKSTKAKAPTEQKTPAAPVQEKTWTCEQCQASNPDDTRECTNCGSKRTFELELGGWGDLFTKQYENKWKCEGCSVYNENSRTKCVACETPCPGTSAATGATAEKKVQTNPAGSIGPGGFSFGAASGTSSSGGFSFGAKSPAPASSSTTGGFSFGTSSAAPATSSGNGGGYQFGSGSKTESSSVPGGFEFGSSAPAPATTGGGFTFGSSNSAPTPASRGTNGGSGGFKFGGSSSAPTPASDAISKDASKEDTSSTKPAFSFGSKPASDPTPQSASMSGVFKLGSVPSNDTKTGEDGENSAKPIGFSFASAPAPSDGEEKPFKFNVDEKKSDDPANPFTFGSSTPPNKSETQVPATEPASKRTRPESGNHGTNSADKASNRPNFNFGGSSSAQTGFTFGSSAPTPASDSAPAFSFGGSSSSEGKAHAAPLGSVPSKDSETDDRSTRRHGRGDEASSAPPPSSGAPAAAPAFSFGSTPAPAPVNFGAPASASFKSSAPAPAAESGSSTFSFGTSVPTPATTPAAAPFYFGSGSSTSHDAAPPAAPMFGSTSASSAPTFGSGPAAPSAAPAFGSAPVHTAGGTNPFGTSTPAPAPSFSFGSTPAPAPAGAASSAFSFGSTPAPAPSFGGAPVPAAPGFGLTPGSSAPFGPSSAAAAPGGFGDVPTASAPFFGGAAPAPFGAPASGDFGGSNGFGGPPPPAPATFGAPAPGGFGGPAPAPGGFSGGGGFGTPAAPPAPGAFVASAGGDVPQFSIGTGGGSQSRGTSGRRIVKARRPRKA